MLGGLIPSLSLSLSLSLYVSLSLSLPLSENRNVKRPHPTINPADPAAIEDKELHRTNNPNVSLVLPLSFYPSLLTRSLSLSLSLSLALSLSRGLLCPAMSLSLYSPYLTRPVHLSPPSARFFSFAL